MVGALNPSNSKKTWVPNSPRRPETATNQVMDEHNRLEVAFKSIVQKREDLIVKKLNMSVTVSYTHLTLPTKLEV